MKITELPIERRQIFDKCMKIESIEDLLSIQEEIAIAIRRYERELAKGQHRDVLRFHISRLRLYVDGLVWLVLHPHTIRQMAKNPSPPPSIESQGETFDRVLESARAFAEQYQVPVFVADITNILRVGDLVVCASHEVPVIVEYKTRLPQPKHLMQGRIGRQVSRAMGTLEYLTEGAVRLFGEDKHRQVIETPYIAQRNWEIITSICQTARNDGHASCQISEYEVFWAYTREHSGSLGDEIKAYADQDEEVFLGTSVGLMNRMDGLFPSPIAWPIPAESRFLLLEEEIIVAHLVDTRAFEHCSASKGAIEIHPRDTFPVRVKTDQNQYSLSRRFVYDVLYGFENVDSCVQGLIDFAHKIESSTPFNVKEVASEKPVVHHVESLAEAQRLVESGISDKNALVSMPTSLFEKLQNKPGGLLDNAESGVLIASETQGYVLSNLRTLEEELKNTLTGEINPTLESDKGD